MRRTQTDAGINYHNHLSAMASASLPIGIIPAGKMRYEGSASVFNYGKSYCTLKQFDVIDQYIT